MGVDCVITLPGNVRVQDVADVIGVAAGLKPIKTYATGGDIWYVRVVGVSVVSYEHSILPSCARIVLSGLMVDGETGHEVMYHFESSGLDKSSRLMLPRSTPFWICIGRRLVDFFGGDLDYRDCDSTEIDYSVPCRSDQDNGAVDDEWANFQLRKIAVVPITQGELDEYKDVAAYRYSEDMAYDAVRKAVVEYTNSDKSTPDGVLADALVEKNPLNVETGWMEALLRAHEAD